MSIKPWQDTYNNTACSVEQAMQGDINELRAELEHMTGVAQKFCVRLTMAEAELAKLKQQEPFGSINKNHLINTQEPWCREILLYSPNNAGDTPERRVLVYLAAGAQPTKAIAKIIGVGKDYRPCEHETGEYRNEDGVCIEFADGSRDCVYASDLFVKGAQP